MSQKKIFLTLLVISTVSLLLYEGGHLESWTTEAFYLGCPSVGSQLPKHTHVAFLKTHKTASSTMQNLLFRFAERNNLTVALPAPHCGHQFCYPQSFVVGSVHPQTLPAAVIASHMRFNLAELRRVMPRDTVYVTILREPGTMFESLFGYYNQISPAFRRVPNGSLQAFLEDPWRYYRPAEQYSMLARNTLTYDLGGDNDRPAEDAAAYGLAFTAETERTFSLVMISEHFDESLVLLRHLLSWDMEDLLYLKLNMRAEGSKHSLSPYLRGKIRQWNALDAHLYDHFNASLWRQISALGPACVAREVRLLHKASERLLRSCFGGGLPQERAASKIKSKELRPWQPSSKVEIVGYELPANLTQGNGAGASAGAGSGSRPGGAVDDICLKLIMPELQHTDVLMRRQLLRYRLTAQARTQLRTQLRTQTSRQTTRQASRVVLRPPLPPQNQQEGPPPVTPPQEPGA